MGSEAHEGDRDDDQDRRALGQEVSRQAHDRARMAKDMPKTTQDGARVALEGAKMAEDPGSFLGNTFAPKTLFFIRKTQDF